MAENSGAIAGCPYPLEPEPDGPGHGNFAYLAVTMAVGSTGPAPSPRTFKRSNDSAFEVKPRDVLDFYSNKTPYENVLAADAKP